MDIKEQIEHELEQERTVGKTLRSIPFIELDPLTFNEIVKKGYQLEFCYEIEEEDYYIGDVAMTETGAVIVFPNIKDEKGLRSLIKHYG